MGNKIAIIHGSWVPSPDNETGWELAITPIIQTYCNSNCTRYIPQGKFSLVNLTESTDLNVAIFDSMSFTQEVKDFIHVRNVPDVRRLTPVADFMASLTLHNLGTVADDIEEYDIYLMLPRSLVAKINDPCFAWDTLWLLRDIEIEPTSAFELEVFSLLQAVQFKNESHGNAVDRESKSE